MKATILALFVVLAVAGAEAGRTRRYYISADELEWDYCPNGPRDGQDGSYLITPGPLRLGSSYRKAIYREYTDSTFSNLKVRSRDDEHLGILGPTLYAEVGDVFEVSSLPSPTSHSSGSWTDPSAALPLRSHFNLLCFRLRLAWAIVCTAVWESGCFHIYDLLLEIHHRKHTRRNSSFSFLSFN